MAKKTADAAMTAPAETNPATTLEKIGELAIAAQRAGDLAAYARATGRSPQGSDGQRDLDRRAAHAAAALRAAIDDAHPAARAVVPTEPAKNADEEGTPTEGSGRPWLSSATGRAHGT